MDIGEGSRDSGFLVNRVIPLIAASWSLFQLLVAQWLLLDSVVVRSVHLAFALTMVLFSFGSGQRVRWWDVALGVVGSAAALYLIADYEGISERQGLPLLRDLIAGGVLITVLLEAARRALGPALPIIAILFILSSLFASSLPAFLASRDVSMSHLIGKLTLSTEGVYGIPLRVSSDTVFLFVLFGAMLERAGGGQFFVDLATSLLGRYRGGPAKAAVLASGLTGMVSGSSIANTVTTGTFTIPLMKRCGYPATKAAAIEVAASTNGQLMPPIMGAAAFIIAEYCNMPYMEVVRAAIIPALLSYLALIYITHLEARKLRLEPLPREELPNAFQVIGEGAHFLIPLAYLVYLLVIERYSPSLAAFRAIGVLSLVVIVREGLVGSWTRGLRMLGESLVTGAKHMMGIGVAVAAAGIIVGVVSMGLGGKVTEVIGFLSMGQLYPLLIVTAIVSLVLGMGLPTTANYIIMANLTAPAIIALSGEMGLAVPLIAAHLFCFYFGILADDTPPVGLAAYAASAIAKSPPLKTGVQGFLYDLRTALLPFMFILNSELLLIGVDSVPHAILVFATGLIAMCAFAAATQGYFLRHNRWYETIALVIVVFLFLQPRWFSLYPWIAYAYGLILISLVAFLQRRRSEQVADV